MPGFGILRINVSAVVVRPFYSAGFRVAIIHDIIGMALQHVSLAPADVVAQSGSLETVPLSPNHPKQLAA